MSGWRFVPVVAALVMLSGESWAKPYVPESDAVVLEHLPEKNDPALAQLKRMRATLMMDPRNLNLAVSVARRALEAGRRLGDPRFFGQAQAALAPWWGGEDVPPAALLLRATLKQSQHDFEGSIADLDRLLAAHPALAQARLTRATVLAVRGRYADALHDCEQLKGHVVPIVLIGCDATSASLTGNAAGAYGALVQVLAQGVGNLDVREWASTLAAEIAARRGDFDAAERHFRDALALDPRDAYLQGAYADFLLDRGRPRELLPLLRDATKNDALLLRLALAEQQLPELRESFAVHREDLSVRFDAARRRGDSLHRREEARFRLTVEHDAKVALNLARENWLVQREPSDLRILIEAARAAGDADALKIASDWVAATHLEDAAIVTLLRARQ
ncbi:tetratricopeptide repeat protein [Paraburkholderia hospita]|nr:tetratricopeptide repeat protein [Paraburkholderia hospita]SEI28551.1 Tetratricopeptide repeat-containing protein [Paraburkholderia hospita]